MIPIKKISYSIHKNKWLKEKRGVDFENVKQAIADNQLLEIVRHPKRKNQKLLVLVIDNYIWLAPFVEEKDYIFLKTVYPSRQYTKKYLTNLKGKNEYEKKSF